MKKLLLTTIIALVSTVCIAQVSSTEKQALLDFYNALNGDEWVQSWDLETPVSNWQGVTLENDKVIAISLLFNNLKGELPGSIEDLRHLKVLELSFNKIEGAIPEVIGKLQELEIIALNANNLGEALPESLGNLSNLRQLHLSSNSFTGTVPASFEKLTSLETLNVFDNQLSGALPKGIADITSLQELMVSGNSFTNPEDFSYTLLTKSGVLDLNQKSTLTPATKTVIAIETSDDEN